MGRGACAEDRAVVDDAPAHRHLLLHHAEGFLGAEKRAGEIGIDDGFPALEREIFDRLARPDAGIVEKHVEPAKGFPRLLEEALDLGGISDVGRDRESPPATLLDRARRLIECRGAPPGKNEREACLREGERRGPADPAPGARHKGDFAIRIHEAALPFLSIDPAAGKRRDSAPGDRPLLEEASPGVERAMAA